MTYPTGVRKVNQSMGSEDFKEETIGIEMTNEQTIMEDKGVY